jgi:steroid delta-isomerase-like uncharacterized protein
MPQTSTATNLDQLVDEHFRAELRGDVDSLIATFTSDVEHDVVGNPVVSHGRAETAAFYRGLFADLDLERFETVHRYRGTNFIVDESIVHARAIGAPLGIPGNNRPLVFRLLHVFEVQEGRISRENAWLDTAAIFSQLS